MCVPVPLAFLQAAHCLAISQSQFVFELQNGAMPQLRPYVVAWRVLSSKHSWWQGTVEEGEQTCLFVAPCSHARQTWSLWPAQC